MSLRALLTLCLTIGMHSSLCTGGLFAVIGAVSQEVAYQTEAVAPMSYGAIDYLSCKTSKSSHEVSQTGEGGCSDAEVCLSRVSSRIKNQLFNVSAVSVELLTSFYEMPTPISYHMQPMVLARAGPLYESAADLPTSLLKRE